MWVCPRRAVYECVFGVVAVVAVVGGGGPLAVNGWVGVLVSWCLGAWVGGWVDGWVGGGGVCACVCLGVRARRLPALLPALCHPSPPGGW